jgi:glutamate-1-semialdehyde aminotransferase
LEDAEIMNLGGGKGQTSGTYNSNSLVTAGLATLEELMKDDGVVYADDQTRGEAHGQDQEIFSKHKIPVVVQGPGPFSVRSLQRNP